MGSNKNRKPLLYLRDMYCYKDYSSRQPRTKKSFGRPGAVDTTPNKYWAYNPGNKFMRIIFCFTFLKRIYSFLLLRSSFMYLGHPPPLPQINVEP